MMTSRWKIFVILLVIVSAVLMVASIMLQWEPFHNLRLRDPQWMENRVPGVSQLEQTPTLLSVFVMLLTLFLSGVVLMYLFPRRIRHMADSFHNPFSTFLRLFLIGLLVVLFAVAVGISSALSIGTFPITLFLFSLLFLTGLAGGISLAFSLGRFFLQKAGWGSISPFISLLLGLFVLDAFGHLPVFGIFVMIVVICLGLGSAVATRYGSGWGWNIKPLMNEEVIE